MVSFTTSRFSTNLELLYISDDTTAHEFVKDEAKVHDAYIVYFMHSAT